MIGLPPDVTPVVVVLCEDLEERLGHLDPLSSRLELRYTDATGLPEAIVGAQVLFLWDTIGEPDAAQAMAGHIRERFGWQIEVPQYGEKFELS